MIEDIGDKKAEKHNDDGIDKGPSYRFQKNLTILHIGQERIRIVLETDESSRDRTEPDLNVAKGIIKGLNH